MLMYRKKKKLRIGLPHDRFLCNNVILITDQRSLQNDEPNGKVIRKSKTFRLENLPNSLLTALDNESE